MTKHQKELKKDYVFKQSKLHSSNTVPPWDDMWVAIQNSDATNDYINSMRSDAERNGEEFDEKAALQALEDEQQSRYFDIVQEYKYLDGDPCWREMTIPTWLDPTKIAQLGIYWAVKEDAAEAHWGYRTKGRISVTYKGIIALDNIDWSGTMFARMDMSLGDTEQEIRFLKNSPIFIESVYSDKEEKWIPINDTRRT